MKPVTNQQHGLNPQAMQACAEELAAIAQKYNSTLGTNLKLEMTNTLNQGCPEVNVSAITQDGKRHSLVRMILKRDEPTKQDLGLKMQLYKA